MILTNEDKLKHDVIALYSCGWCLDYITNEVLLHSDEYGTSLNYQELIAYVKNATENESLNSSQSGVKVFNTIRQINNANGYKHVHSTTVFSEDCGVNEIHDADMQRINNRQQEDLELEYVLAKTLLNSLNVKYEALTHKTGLFHRIISSIYSLFDHRDRVIRDRDRAIRHRDRVIEIARKHLYLMGHDELLDYIIKHRHEFAVSESNFICAHYVRKYWRIRHTHCFRCIRDLVTSFFNICNSCGWIRCACGACGCTYR